MERLMSEKKTPVLEVGVPVLSVDNLSEAMDYYNKVLGFQTNWTWGEPPYLACMCRDRVELNLGERGKIGPLGTSKVYFRMSGVETYYDQAKNAGAKIISPLGDRPYGMKDFNLHDSSGNDLGFGESIVE
jgi:uncharacterized glyoxalase superfamily protein PhnB